jgi:membrane-bound serine protease (ClpP class)
MKRNIFFTLMIIFVISITLSTAIGDKSYKPKVYVVEIRNAIGNGLREYISRGINSAKTENADVLLFNIHTPGGALNATSDIIKMINESGIPTIAFVNDEAISAGAIITLSCDKIALAPGGTIGDAQPIPTNEKSVSYVRGKIYATAEEQGRDPGVAAAMVDKDIILVKLEDGSVKALSPEEYANRQKENVEMTVISPRGNILTISTKQALELGVADIEADNISEILKSFSLVELDGTKKLLETDKLSISDYTLIANLSDAEVREIEMTIAEKIATFVTNPMIASILLSLGILGMIFEFKTVGWGVAGTLAFLCFALFFGGHMIARINASIGLLIFIIGVGLLLVEIFLIPGFGAAGISGIILIFGGLLFTLGTNTGSWSMAVVTLSQAFIIILVLGGFLIYFLPKTSLWQSTVLQTEATSEAGYKASSALFTDLEGKRGVTLTPLRPAGVVLIDGERVNVVSEGSFVDKDTPVQVFKVEGGRVIVHAV